MNIRRIIREEIERVFETDGFDAYSIRKFSLEDRSRVMELMIQAFSHLMPESQIPAYTDHFTNYKKSIVLEKGGEVVGAYLIGDRQLRDGVEDYLNSNVYVNLDDYDEKEGVEGVALVVDEAHRGGGVGSKLKDYVEKLGVDYIWGLQYKALGNLEHWKKRRILAAETPEINITLEDFNKNVDNKKVIGYKVMRYENGKLISGANSNLTFEPKIGEYIKMPGQGIFMSPLKDYVLDYYSGLSDTEALLTFEFDPSDVVFGNLTDKEPEVGVSKAKLIDIEIIDGE